MAKKKPFQSKLLPESVTAAINSSSTVNGGDTPFGGPNTSGGERRIAGCSEARELFLRLQRENQFRAQTFAQIRNQVEGGRPFDPATLRKNGEEGRTNCNFNDARAAYRRACLPYWKMVHEVPRKIAVTVHSGAPDAGRQGIALAECFDRFLDDWGADYYLQFEGFTGDMVMFGPGYTMWEDELTPRYKWAQTVQLLFPKRTKANPDDWELVALRREMTADQLIAKVRDGAGKKLSKKAGWNPGAIEEAIKLAAPENVQSRLLDPNYWQDMIVANDLVIGGTWPPVAVVDVWAKQRDGSIAHYIFTEKTDVGEYLYESKEEAREFRRIFGPIFYNVGSNGLLHSIKGFGVMNYYYATVINRMKCKAADAVGLTMGLNFTKDDDTPDEAPPVQNWSFFNVLPKGLTQLTIYPQLQPAMELMKSLQENQNENNYTYSEQGTQQNIATTDTKGQADLIASISAEGESSQASVYLSQMAQNIFTEMYRRLCQKRGDPDAKKFRERAIALGVPEQVLDGKGQDGKPIEITVKCGASPTMASPAVRGKIGQQLMAMANQPGMNVRAIQEFNVANLAGSEGIPTFMLPIGVDSDPRARREAIMENEDLAHGVQLGNPPDFGVDPSDDHAAHADEHLKPLEQILLAAKQGAQQNLPAPGQPMAPPTQITPDHLMAMQGIIPHVGPHVQYLAADPTKSGIYKQMNARLKLVETMAKGIITRLARAQANGQQPNSNGLDHGAVRTALAGPRQ